MTRRIVVSLSPRQPWEPVESRRWFNALRAGAAPTVSPDLIEAARDLVRECEEHETPSWNAVQRLKSALS